MLSVVGAVIGIILAIISYKFLTCIEGNSHLRASLTLLSLSLPVFLILWYFRTRDTRENINNDFFFNAANLVGQNEPQAKSIGIKLLMNLKNNLGVYKDRIDLITQGLNLEGVNLNHFDLRGINLENSILIQSSLRNTNLQNSNLKHSFLQHVNLEEADLQSANLQNAKLQNTVIRNAHLKQAILHSANLQNADLRNAKLQNAKLGEVHFLESAHLKEAIYNKKTTFPDRFKPEDYGMIKEKEEKIN